MFAPPRSFSQLTTTFFARQLLRHPPWTLSRLTIFCDYALSLRITCFTSSCPAFLRRLLVLRSRTTATPRTGPAHACSARTHDARSSLSLPFPICVKDPWTLLTSASGAFVGTKLLSPKLLPPALQAFALSTRAALRAPLRRVAFMCTKPETYPSASPGLRSI